MYKVLNGANFHEIIIELSRFNEEFLDSHLLRRIEDNWQLFKTTFSNLIGQHVTVLIIKASNIAPVDLIKKEATVQNAGQK